MGKCLSRGEPFDPGAVLDAVVASNDAAERCCMYQLANFKKGGQLVELFNKGGSLEARTIVYYYSSIPMIRHQSGR